MELSSVFLSSYTFIKDGIRTNSAGPVTPIINYFKNKARKLFVLEQPLPGSDHLNPIFTEINSKKEKLFCFTFKLGKKAKTFDSNKTYFRLKLRDIISNFWAIFENRNKFKKEPIDLFIGVESINAICGIIFKKLGLVKKVIYYVFDWAPDRYQNKLINMIYIWLDRIATYNSDVTWNIAYTIAEARKRILKYDEKKMSPQIYVPYSPNFSEKFIRTDNEIDSDLIIYSGGLIPENGPDLALEAFEIVNREYPKSKFLIIGSGELEKKLYDDVIKLNLQNSVNFTGYIAKEEKVLELQSQGAIGIAPYPIMKGSRKPFGDVIKIRMYFVSGLVVVSTPVPPVAKEIKEENLGIVTSDDSPKEIAKAILELLHNKEKLFEMRKNVINKAKSSTWEKTYTKALSQIKLR